MSLLGDCPGGLRRDASGIPPRGVAKHPDASGERVGVEGGESLGARGLRGANDYVYCIMLRCNTMIVQGFLWRSHYI